VERRGPGSHRGSATDPRVLALDALALNHSDPCGVPSEKDGTPQVGVILL